MRLVRTLNAPDPPGLVALCRRIYPDLVGALTLHCGDAGVAEEVAQEALVRAWLRWAEVSRMDAPAAWVYRVAFNLTTSRFRRHAAERRAHRKLTSTVRTDTPADDADRIAVRAAVATLPERQRMALVLRYYADLSVDDVAQVMACASGTVKSLTSKAIESLRDRFGLDLDEEVAHG